MSQIRFNQAFIGLVTAGVASMFFVPPSVTDRAKGKEELLLLPVVRPVRAIASMFHAKYGDRPLPPGETRQRTDSELAAENAELRQQLVYLNRQLEDLQLVEADLKRLGPLLKDFKPVKVIGGDASPGRESLGLMPATGVNLDDGAWVMGIDGLVGRVQANRVRLITDGASLVLGAFGRWQNGQWTPLATSLKASVAGANGGSMRISHLTLKEVAELKPGDWVVVAEVDGPRRELFKGRLIGQIESIKPLASKPLFADITVKPKADLRQLDSVLALKR